MSPGCTAEGRRILTLMEIYEFQIARAFAKEIRGAAAPVQCDRCRSTAPEGTGLCNCGRFPEMSLDFLWRGKSTGLTSLELLKKLRHYERRKRVKLFTARCHAADCAA